MKNSAEFFGTGEEPRSETRSPLAGRTGHGSQREKRASVAEVFAKLKEIISILPHDSKERLGRQVENIRRNPEEAIEIMRKEIEAQRTVTKRAS